ncbi:MAG TPA: hypothetical protein VI039_13120 [Solirubrobacterales bacterium]
MPNSAPRIPEDHPAVEELAKRSYMNWYSGRGEVPTWEAATAEARRPFVKEAIEILAEIQPHLYQLFLEQDEQKLGSEESDWPEHTIVRFQVGARAEVGDNFMYGISFDPEKVDRYDESETYVPKGRFKARLAVEEVAREKAERELEQVRAAGLRELRDALHAAGVINAEEVEDDPGELVEAIRAFVAEREQVEERWKDAERLCGVACNERDVAEKQLNQVREEVERLGERAEALDDFRSDEANPLDERHQAEGARGALAESIKRLTAILDSSPSLSGDGGSSGVGGQFTLRTDDAGKRWEVIDSPDVIFDGEEVVVEDVSAFRGRLCSLLGEIYEVGSIPDTDEVGAPQEIDGPALWSAIDALNAEIESPRATANFGDVKERGEEGGCERPPAGWRCTRGAGHDGPCAAVPTAEGDARLEAATAAARAWMVDHDLDGFWFGSLAADVVAATDRAVLSDESIRELTKQIVEGSDGEVISLPYATVRDALANVLHVDLTQQSSTTSNSLSRVPGDREKLRELLLATADKVEEELGLCVTCGQWKPGVVCVEDDGDPLCPGCIAIRADELEEAAKQRFIADRKPDLPDIEWEELSEAERASYRSTSTQPVSPQPDSTTRLSEDGQPQLSDEDREELERIATICKGESIGPADVWDRAAAFLRKLASQPQQQPEKRELGGMAKVQARVNELRRDALSTGDTRAISVINRVQEALDATGIRGDLICSTCGRLDGRPHNADCAFAKEERQQHGEVEEDAGVVPEWETVAVADIAEGDTLRIGYWSRQVGRTKVIREVVGIPVPGAAFLLRDNSGESDQDYQWTPDDSETVERRPQHHVPTKGEGGGSNGG